MNRLHLINANKIFNPHEKELLKKLYGALSLNLMILEDGNVITNRRAYKKSARTVAIKMLFPILLKTSKTNLAAVLNCASSKQKTAIISC